MAFGLTKANYYQIVNSSPSLRDNLQVLEFFITRANTDTDLDFFDSAGTFWAAVGGSGLGLAAKTALMPIFDQVNGLVSVSILGNGGVLIPAAAATATAFVLTNDAVFPAFKPAITLVSGSGSTTLEVTLVLTLNDTVAPVEFSS